MAAAPSSDPIDRRTASIWAAVSPRAPARAIARAIAMLAGETTMSALPAPRASSRYRSKPKASMARAASLAATGSAGAPPPRPGGLTPLVCPDTIDGAIERSHDADASALRARDEVRVGEVEPVNVVELDGTKQKRVIHD